MNKVIVAILFLGLLSFGIGSINAMHVYWNDPNPNGPGYYNIDQYMWLEQKSPTTFYAMFWRFYNSSVTISGGFPSGGYLGLQTQGNFYNNALPPQEIAIFSVWDANGAQGFNCGQFSGEGNGYSCRIPFKFTTNTIYKYRVWAVGHDSMGEWWSAWVNDKWVGEIRIPWFTRIKQNSDFTEYYGPNGNNCNSFAKSTVVWSQPLFDDNGYIGAYSGFDNSCGGIVAPLNYYKSVGI